MQSDKENANRHGDWKVVKDGKGAPEAAKDSKLFNVTNDPKETTDVATDNVPVLESHHQAFLRHRLKDRQ